MKAKRFLSTVLSVCLTVLTLFSFAGCGENGANGAEELKKQIAELTTQVQTLETALKEEQDKNAENQAKLDELETSLKTEQGKNAESEKPLLYGFCGLILLIFRLAGQIDSQTLEGPFINCGKNNG